MKLEKDMVPAWRRVVFDRIHTVILVRLALVLGLMFWTVSGGERAFFAAVAILAAFEYVTMRLQRRLLINVVNEPVGVRAYRESGERRMAAPWTPHLDDVGRFQYHGRATSKPVRILEPIYDYGGEE